MFWKFAGGVVVGTVIGVIIEKPLEKLIGKLTNHRFGHGRELPPHNEAGENETTAGPAPAPAVEEKRAANVVPLKR